MMRVCTKCGEEKALEGFHRDATASEGRSRRCAECAREAVRRWVAANPKRKAAADRAWAVRNRPRRQEIAREWARKNGRGVRVTPADPEKVRARRTLRTAVEAGRVERLASCESCGEFPRAIDGRTLVEAHHEDYSRPLDVRWLCSICHGVEHQVAA